MNNQTIMQKVKLGIKKEMTNSKNVNNPITAESKEEKKMK